MNVIYKPVLTLDDLVAIRLAVKDKVALFKAEREKYASSEYAQQAYGELIAELETAYSKISLGNINAEVTES